MSLQKSGTIKTILDLERGESKSGKEWTKQCFVIDTGDQYNPDICFQLFGNKTSLLEHLKIGQSVTVNFNVSSREYNGKYYHNIDAWKIEVIEKPNAANATGKTLADVPEDDDLTF